MPPDPRKRDAGAVLDILCACRKIESFAGGKNLQSFRTDDLIQSAVLFQLLIMGEAAKRITAALPLATPKFLGPRWPACATD